METAMKKTPYAHPVPDACDLLGIKSSKLYTEIAKGRIRAKKIGTRTVVLDESIREYLAAQPDARITYTKA
jgi:excisionase family DNA binding protein